jgi:hypothetical protein
MLTDWTQVLERLQEARLREFFRPIATGKLMRTLTDPALDLPHPVQGR